MDFAEVEANILQHGGEIKPSINWIWAYFENEYKARECYEQVRNHISHRGFWPAHPDDTNPNLRKAGFRYRPRSWGE